MKIKKHNEAQLLEALFLEFLILLGLVRHMRYALHCPVYLLARGCSPRAAAYLLLLQTVIREMVKVDILFAQAFLPD